MSLRSISIVLLAGMPLLAHGQAASVSVEERLRRLEERQEQLEEELKQKDARIGELERQLGASTPAAAAGTSSEAGPAAPAAAGGQAPDAEPAAVVAAAVESAPQQPAGTFINPDTPLAAGRGFEVGRNEYGSLNIGAYALVRAIDQLPASQDATDHLGRPLGGSGEVDTRQDINLHRAMINLRGFMFDPQFNYALTVWTVNATEQVRIVGSLGYTFSDALTLGAGISGTPGTRSMMGSHPFWLGHDRTLADEYFRTGFSSGVWISGQTPRGANYKFMVSNNISTLGVNAVEDTRDLAYSGTVWWMPTTGEYGPQGAYGDFEYHEELATRFGISYARSPREDRTAQPDSQSPDSTQIRLGDSLLLFERDALGDGVTVQTANFELLAIDLGFKYRGFFLQTEAYYRTLNDFRLADFSTAPLPTRSIRDKGFYVQTGFFPLPKKLELYASTSRIYPDGDAGFSDSRDVAIGANWYWSGTRYQRMNLQYIDVKDSPASSTFGYFTGGLDGQVITLEASVLF